MTRMCKRCGKEITDLYIWPTATLCPECRGKSLQSNFYKGHNEQEQIAILTDYLERHDWPTYISSQLIIDTEPEIIERMGFTPDKMQMARRAISVRIRQVRTPQGEQYTRRGRRSRGTVYEIRQEATA